MLFIKHESKKMKKSAILTIGVLLLMIIAGTSCKEKRLTRLEGRWILHHFDTTERSYTEIWEFTKNDLTIFHDYGSDEPTKIDEGTFIFKTRLTKNLLEMQGFGENPSNEFRNIFYNTTWTVTQLKEDKLSLYSDKENNLLFYEFLKEE